MNDLQSSNGKLRLVLRSRKVVARIVEFEAASTSSTSLMTFNGQVFGSRKRVPVYDYVFDEEQTRALREARDLAMRSGLELEVTDLTRQGLVKRTLRIGLSKVSWDDLTRYLSHGPKEVSEEIQEPETMSSPVSRP